MLQILISDIPTHYIHFLFYKNFRDTYKISICKLVHGNWGEIPGNCPECGPGNKTTEKWCNNPEPQHGGDPCDCDNATFAIAGNFCNGTYAKITEICSEWTDCTTPQPTTTPAPESGMGKWI